MKTKIINLGFFFTNEHCNANLNFIFKLARRSDIKTQKQHQKYKMAETNIKKILILGNRLLG